jgi:gas vesicle protein
MKKAILLLLAGVVMGIFIAPARGSETWQNLLDGIDDFKDDVKNKLNDLVGSGKEAVNNAIALTDDASF